jgi:NitT/TauT family transport system ATP-binding protein
MIQASGTARSAGGAASIEGRGVIKTFPTRGGTFTAVDNLTLNIARGEFVSLIGPSGCGKSTFLLMAAGLQPLSKGEILVNGSVLDKPLTDVGIVFQDHLLLEFRTALANVMLSGGMRQRVAIARALIHDPSVLMMDEPFGALDAITRTQIRHDLEVLWMETGKTVLFITHSLEEAIGLSDRVLVMSPTPGRIVDEIKIELPRPRPSHLGDYPSFNAYADRIHEVFRRFGVLKY